MNAPATYSTTQDPHEAESIRRRQAVAKALGLDPLKYSTKQSWAVFNWAEKLEFSALEAEYKLPAGLLSAVMKQESAGDPGAFSNKGKEEQKKAGGLFQFIPGTADRFKIDRWDPKQSARGCAEYQRALLNQFRIEGRPGDKNDLDALPLALAGYNWGEGNVKDNGYITVQRIPETSKYVKAILKDLGKTESDFITPDNLAMKAFYNPSGKQAPTQTAANAKKKEEEEKESKPFDWSLLTRIGGPLLAGIAAFFLGEGLLGMIPAAMVAVGVAFMAGPQLGSFISRLFGISDAKAATSQPSQGISPKQPLLILSPEEVKAVLTKETRPDYVKIVGDTDLQNLKVQGVALHEELNRKDLGVYATAHIDSMNKYCIPLGGVAGLVRNGVASTNDVKAPALSLDCVKRPSQPVATR